VLYPVAQKPSESCTGSHLLAGNFLGQKVGTLTAKNLDLIIKSLGYMSMMFIQK
jgi:hypothetical protein